MHFLIYRSISYDNISWLVIKSAKFSSFTCNDFKTWNKLDEISVMFKFSLVTFSFL